MSTIATFPAPKRAIPTPEHWLVGVLRQRTPVQPAICAMFLVADTRAQELLKPVLVNWPGVRFTILVPEPDVELIEGCSWIFVDLQILYSAMPGELEMFDSDAEAQEPGIRTVPIEIADVGRLVDPTNAFIEALNDAFTRKEPPPTAA